MRRSAALLLLAGCAAAPPPAPTAAGAPGSGTGCEPGWWKAFGDPSLDAAMEEALARNPGLAEAAARTREARALLAAERGGFGPDLDAKAGYSRSRRSGETASRIPGALESDLFEAGFDMAWEIDLFGRTRNAVAAAAADAEEAAAREAAARVSLEAELVRAHLEACAGRELARLTRETAELLGQALALIEDRARSGLLGRLEPARAASVLANLRAELPALERRSREAQRRVWVLSGRDPGTAPEAGPMPEAGPPVPAELPAELLKRRPDVAASGRAAAAAAARHGVARSELFPRLVLTGAWSLQAEEAGDLDRSSAQAWSVGPSLKLPIFHSGSLKAMVRAADAREQAALARHDAAVLTALEESSNALEACARTAQRRQALSEAAARDREVLNLVRARYDTGISPFLDVVEAWTDLLGTERSLVEARRDEGVSRAALCKALGGGWRTDG